MHRFLSAAMAAAACFAGYVLPSAAIAQSTQNLREYVPNFDMPTIEPILTEMGVVHERRSSTDGTPYLFATLQNIKFQLWPTSCDSATKSKCAGLQMMAFFPGESLENLNSFNRFPATKATLLNPNQSVVSRYLIGDYGYTKGTFVVNVSVFVAMALKYQRREHAQPSNTISLQAEAADSAASASKISNITSTDAHVVRPSAFELQLIGNAADDLAAQDEIAGMMNDFAQ